MTPSERRDAVARIAIGACLPILGVLVPLSTAAILWALGLRG